MQKGQGFFSIPQAHRVQRRMSELLGIFTRERPVSVWEMTCAVLGEGRALSLGRRKATHLCERIVRSAERNSFIRRLPLRLPPGRGEPVVKRGFNRALAYTITEEGELFLKSYRSYMEDMRNGVSGHRCNGGFHRRRNERRLEKAESRYRRRLSLAMCEATERHRTSSATAGAEGKNKK